MLKREKKSVPNSADPILQVAQPDGESGPVPDLGVLPASANDSALGSQKNNTKSPFYNL